MMRAHMGWAPTQGGGAQGTSPNWAQGWHRGVRARRLLARRLVSMKKMRRCFIIEDEYRGDRMPMRVADRLSTWGHDVHLLHPQASATCLSALTRVGDDRFDAYVLKTVSDGPGICILEAAAASVIAAINNPRAIRLVRDKAAAAARARAARLPFPLTYFVVDVTQAALVSRAHLPPG